MARTHKGDEKQFDLERQAENLVETYRERDLAPDSAIARAEELVAAGQVQAAVHTLRQSLDDKD